MCTDPRLREIWWQELAALSCRDHSSSLTSVSHSLAAVQLITWKRFAVAQATLPSEEIKFSCLISSLPFMVASEILISSTHQWKTLPISQYSVTSESDSWRIEVLCLLLSRDYKYSLLHPLARDIATGRPAREVEHYGREFTHSFSWGCVFGASGNLYSSFTGLSSLPQLPTLYFKLLCIHINPPFFLFELSALNISTHA